MVQRRRCAVLMAIQESEIKVGATYETAGRQLRKVLRLMQQHVLYEVRTPSPPFYRVSVLKRKFAADAIREHDGGTERGASRGSSRQ